MWTISYFRTQSGVAPVLDYLDSLSAKEAASLVRAIQRLERFGIAIGMPHARPLKGKLWELRSHGPSQQHRLLYAAVAGERFLLLHAFTKKTPQTPVRELDLAEARLALWERHLKDVGNE